MDEILRALVRGRSGVRLAVLSGMDGMIVASAVADDDAPPADLLAASVADLFRKVAATQAEAGLGPPEDMTAGGRLGTVAVREVAPGYILLALLRPDAGLGRVRFEMRKAAAKLVPELV